MPPEKKPRQQVNNLEINKLEPSTLNPSFLDTYVRPGISEIHAPDKSNPMLKLASSLGTLQPELQELTKKYEAKEDQEDMAKVEADFANNRPIWNDHIRKGTIPLGVSPYAARAAHRLYLRELSQEYHASATLAFQGEEGAAARESNNPAAMREFLSNHKAKYQEKLHDGQSKALFSPLDLQDVFTPAQEKADAELMRGHAALRVAETERQLTDSVGLSMQGVLNRTFEFFDARTATEEEATKHYATAANEISDLLHNPDHGAVVNGLPGSQANKLVIDHIIGESIRTGERSRLNVLDHLKTPTGAPIGNTRYALDARERAEEKISDLSMRREHFQRWKDLQPYEDATRERQAVVWNREDERYERELAKVTNDRSDEARQENINILQRRVLEGMRRDVKTGPAMIDQALKDLSAVDPKAAVQAENMVHELTRLRVDIQDDPQVVAALRRDIGIDPSRVTLDTLVSKVRAKEISAATMMRLAQELDQVKQDSDHQYMRGSEFKTMLTAVHTSTLLPEDPNSPESQLAATGALSHYRDLATVWIKQHPQGSEAEFRVYMRSELPKTIEQFNPDYGNQQAKKRADDQKARGEVIVQRSRDAQAEREAAKVKAAEEARDAEFKRLRDIESRATQAFIAAQQQAKLKGLDRPEMDDQFSKLRSFILGGK